MNFTHARTACCDGKFIVNLGNKSLIMLVFFPFHCFIKLDIKADFMDLPQIKESFQFTSFFVHMIKSIRYS